MADTAYERYKKDTSKDNLKDYTDFQKAMLGALDQMTEPKKPVKWTMGFGLSHLIQSSKHSFLEVRIVF
jgi:hypothetical protein